MCDYGKADWLNLFEYLPNDWRKELSAYVPQVTTAKIQDFLHNEAFDNTVFPPVKMVFRAFALTPFAKVRVVLLGQDPYHDDHQAHGLCFSVQDGIPLPPSLRNIFKELESDLGCPVPTNGNLECWAEQGILMLNTVLTVRAHQANSHQNCGWQDFTDAVIMAVNKQIHPIIFVLWGNNAQKKQYLIDSSRHRIVLCAHPSPLSAYRGFLGSRPFSTINMMLSDLGHSPIDWRVPETQLELPL